MSSNPYQRLIMIKSRMKYTIISRKCRSISNCLRISFRMFTEQLSPHLATQHIRTTEVVVEAPLINSNNLWKVTLLRALFHSTWWGTNPATIASLKRISTVSHFPTQLEVINTITRLDNHTPKLRLTLHPSSKDLVIKLKVYWTHWDP
jgi:hypothetical protein